MLGTGGPEQLVMVVGFLLAGAAMGLALAFAGRYLAYGRQTAETIKLAHPGSEPRVEQGSDLAGRRIRDLP
jgi:hypothetical protein